MRYHRLRNPAAPWRDIARKIVEQGNHGELLARGGAYYRMTQA